MVQNRKRCESYLNIHLPPPRETLLLVSDHRPPGFAPLSWCCRHLRCTCPSEPAAPGTCSGAPAVGAGAAGGGVGFGGRPQKDVVVGAVPAWEKVRVAHDVERLFHPAAAALAAAGGWEGAGELESKKTGIEFNSRSCVRWPWPRSSSTQPWRGGRCRRWLWWRCRDRWTPSAVAADHRSRNSFTGTITTIVSTDPFSCAPPHHSGDPAKSYKIY